MNDRPQHIVKSFDEDLSRLDNMLAEMGGLVEAQLTSSIRALTRNNVDLAAEVVTRDADIDALDRELEAFAVSLLARRQPLAADLRTIFAALKISSDLERMGDLAKNVAKRTAAVSQFPMVPTTASIASMAHVVQAMIGRVLDAWIARDAAAAEDVCARDIEVDQHHVSLIRELLTYMMEDPRNIGPCTHLLFIAKNLERMGDHATNIAEKIRYAVLGSVPEDNREKLDEAAILPHGDHGDD